MIGMRRILVAAVAALLAVGAAGCSPIPDAEAPPGDGPLVAFYGDSYTLGTGASDPSMRWSSIICEQRGWAEFNPSVNGLGFVNNRGALDLPGDIIAADPDIVFVTMGLNDNFSYDERGEEIREQILADLRLFREHLPDTELIVVSPFWYSEERPESLTTVVKWVKAAAAEVDAPYIAGASKWLQGHPEWMAEDGLHPNDDGYAEMARRMDEELRAIGY